MKQEDIVQLADKDLNEKINEEKESLGKLRLNHIVSPIENPLKIRTNRKLVARLLTEQSKRRKAADKA